MLIIRASQRDALREALRERMIRALMAEIRADFFEAAHDSDPGEIRAVIDAAAAAAPGYGVETWPGVALLAKTFFALGGAPAEHPRLAFAERILRDELYATEAERLSALTAAVARYLDVADDAPSAPDAG